MTLEPTLLPSFTVRRALPGQDVIKEEVRVITPAARAMATPTKLTFTSAGEAST